MGAVRHRRSAGAVAFFLLFVCISSARAGLVHLEVRPATQTVTVGDPVDIGLYAVSADGFDQTVGLVGVAIGWDSTKLALTGRSDAGAPSWASSGFPSDPAGLNNTFLDGDAYYQAIVVEGGSLPVATAAGTLVTTLQFGTVSAAGGATAVSLAACIGTTCTLVLDRHPFSPGVQDITGDLLGPVDVTIECESQDDCDDANPCTDDVCDVESLCTHTVNDSNDADDGLFCNGHEICSGGAVITEPDSVPDCDDHLGCTADQCNEVGNYCENDLIAGFCLIEAACFSNGSLNPVNDCEACDASVTPEDWTVRALGAACGDPTNTTCDGADTCDGSGTCQDSFAPAGTSCGSASNTLCTDPDTCDGIGTCNPHDEPNGTACDDGWFCTVTDTCADGICVGTGARCTDHVCDEATDKCKSVGLALRPALQGPVVVDDIVEIGLYAVSETGGNQAIAAVNVILVWDAARLTLLGRVNNGPYSWLLSTFPNDAALDGLNDTFHDGNALYQALVMPAPSPPAVATPAGLLITTLRFQSVGDGMGWVQVAATAGQSTETVVLDAETVGLAITGSLGEAATVEIIECLVDEDCDDGEFCTGEETCAGTYCVPGTPPDCDDGLFCNGVETCQPGVGCVSMGNPCPEPSSCHEADDDCGGCRTPDVAAEGCRYLAVTPAPDADPVALLVKAASPDPPVSCVSAYVQADGSLARGAPVYLTPAEWETVHVTGLDMVPSTAYAVYADCRPTGTGYLSAPASATTWRWGDVNNDGAVQISDVTLVHNGSQGIFEGTTVENLDLAGCVPNGQVDAEDVASVQSAYLGGAYNCPPPCAVCLSIAPPYAESSVVAKNRYVSFQGGHPGERIAVRVKFANLPAPFQGLNGETMWVGEPVETCENAGETLPPAGGCPPVPGLPSTVFWSALLRCKPYYTDWNDYGTVHVHGMGIIPGAVYELQVIDEICDVNVETTYSTALPVATSRWGDVVSNCSTLPCGPPDGTVNITTDATAVLDRFRNLPGAPTKARCDIEPRLPDRRVNITDIVYVVDAFRGMAYPFAGPTPQDLCP